MRPVGHPLLKLPRYWKRAIVVGTDIATCFLTVWLAYYLRLNDWVAMYGQPTFVALLSVALALPLFSIAGMYRIVLRHAGSDVVTRGAAACGLYGLAFAAIITTYGIDGVPRTVGLIQPCLLFLGSSATRIIASTLLSGRLQRFNRAADHGRALIYGAGSSGQQLAAAMAESRHLKIVGFLDDDRSLHHSLVRGLTVFDPLDLAAHVDRYEISDILLALPSVSRARRNEIIAALKELNINVRTLPGLLDLAHGSVEASDLRELTIDDLLGRDPVAYDRDSLVAQIAGKVVMVTGAGGSIGSELSRQLFLMGPSKLLLVDASEFALYSINQQLSGGMSDVVVPLLASVNDADRIATILATWRPAKVFHAAAYKHVPLVEHNPLEGLRNNVFGTLVVAEESRRAGVAEFVLVSTDKAVRPTNIMGASKRLSELVLQGLANEKAGRTAYSMVRFGNVLGSSGSVVPLFRAQIQQGGPVTLTHRDITRYFMTIPEAAHLVLQASIMAHGGEVFVLDMGDPVRIYDLACNLVQLSGLSVRDDTNPDGDIEISIVGMRPGEKLHEELLIGNAPVTTSHPRIMMANEPFMPMPRLRAQLERMAAHIEQGDVTGARMMLAELVPEFAPASEIVDHIHLARTGEQDGAGLTSDPRLRSTQNGPLNPLHKATEASQPSRIARGR